MFVLGLDSGYMDKWGVPSGTGVYLTVYPMHSVQLKKCKNKVQAPYRWGQKNKNNSPKDVKNIDTIYNSQRTKYI